jgi:hypothetical protein
LGITPGYLSNSRRALVVPLQKLRRFGTVSLTGGIARNDHYDLERMEKEMVFTGGGSETSLIKVAPQELVRANSGSIVRVRK